MNPVHFYKMSGCGNDFIIIDNRSQVIEENDLSAFIVGVCRRKMSVGADGIILIENSDTVDFKWRFYNSDGSLAEMCGNGARCVARFAYLNGITGPDMAFETLAGVVSASVAETGLVKIKVTDPLNLKLDYPIDLRSGNFLISSVNTGVPHVVMVVDNLDETPVKEMGKEIRFHPDFAPAGTNANFVSVQPDNIVAIRTYERGVEDETLACGTGCVASALIMSHKFGLASPVTLLTRSGGYLRIYFTHHQGAYSDVYLEGDARVIYRAELCEEAWNY
ncbi:MAG: diaminopimelate epimerase [Deltaproteobacteria bacterium]